MHREAIGPCPSEAQAKPLEGTTLGLKSGAQCIGTGQRRGMCREATKVTCDSQIAESGQSQGMGESSPKREAEA